MGVDFTDMEIPISGRGCLLRLPLAGYRYTCADSTNITLIERNKICYEWNTNTGRLGEDFYADIVTPWLLYGGEPVPSAVLHDAVILNFNEEGNSSLENILREEGAFSLKLGDGLLLFPSMTEVNLLPNLNGKRRCSEDKEKQDCLNDCRAALIMSLCGCYSQTFPNSESASMERQSVKNCAFEQYKKCLNYIGNEDSGCKSNCFPKCQRPLFWFQPDISNGGSYSIIIGLVYSSSDYTIFTEKESWSFNEFIGALGGALGFWLGLDIVVLIELFLKPLILFIRRFAAKASENQKNIELRNKSEKNGAQGETSQNILKRTRAELCNHDRPKSIIWYMETFIWITVYGAGGGYTIFCCLGLIQQYKSKETYSLTRLMINESITLPAVKICIDGAGPLNWANIWLNDPGVRDTNYSDYLTDYFQTNTNGTAFLQEENIWPVKMLLIVKQYLNVIQVAGAYCTPTFGGCSLDIYGYEYYLLFYSQDGQPVNSDQVEAMKNILEPKMSDWNISIKSLQQKMGTELRRLFQLQAIFSRMTHSTNFTNQLQPFSFGVLGTHYMCYTLLANVSFKDPMDRLEISYNLSQLTDYCSSDYSCTFEISVDPYEIYNTVPFITADPAFGYTTNDSILEISLSINGQYKNLSTTADPKLCEAIKDQNFCREKYQIRYIEEKCNCTPISSLNLPSSYVDPCTLARYKECLQNNENKFSNLIDICPPSNTPSNCEYFAYGVHINQKKIFSSDDIARIVVSVNDFTYLSFEEVYDMTYESFLASLSGMIGIVLGLDLRFIATFIITPFVIIIQFCIIRLMRNPKSILHHQRVKKLESYYRKIHSILNTIIGIPADTTKSSFLM